MDQVQPSPAAVSVSHRPPPTPMLDPDLRGYLKTNADILTTITKPVHLDDIGALSAQSEMPILFDSIIERPGFRLCDILVKHRASQCRALGVPQDDYLRTLAHRLRQPPRPFNNVTSGPVKERIFLGADIDLTKLPVPLHKEGDTNPVITTMNIVRDPETGFYNSSHAATHVVGPNLALVSFATPHTHVVMRKYRELGLTKMPIAMIFGVHPAIEIMANFSGLHMDLWGEMDMAGTIMNQDIDMVPCETIDLLVPAHAEIVIEGTIDLTTLREVGEVTAPSMYRLPQKDFVPEYNITAVTMRADRPIYRNHQTCPDTDHQTLPRLCHEAMLYNRLTEIGLTVKDVRFPTFGGALSCLLQFTYPRDGFVNDALMAAMGAPWLNTKLVVALSPDTNLDDPGDVYHAIASRVDPSRDIIIVNNTRGSLYDPSATPLEGQFPFRIVGKMGIDATIKSRQNATDFQRAWPKNWEKVKLKDYL